MIKVLKNRNLCILTICEHLSRGDCKVADEEQDN